MLSKGKSINKKGKTHSLVWLPEVKIDHFACVIREFACNTFHTFASNCTISGLQRNILTLDAQCQAWQVRQMCSFWTASCNFWSLRNLWYCLGGSPPRMWDGRWQDHLKAPAGSSYAWKWGLRRCRPTVQHFRDTWNAPLPASSNCSQMLKTPLNRYSLSFHCEIERISH